jgi:RES domain-containing protein
MILWRISNYTDLSGVGGLKYAARWHSKGKPIIYAAEHPALAMLEILVNSQRTNLPDTYTLLEIEVPNTAMIDNVSGLKSGWQFDENYTRKIGDKWLASVSNPVLRVPSAIMPNAFNYLINPSQKSSALIAIIKIETHSLDPRLR